MTTSRPGGEPGARIVRGSFPALAYFCDSAMETMREVMSTI